MPFVLIYIIKFSISLAVVFLFYQLVLRKLTFYNWNRVYLLGYTLLSFFIPFIDISGTLQQNKLADSQMINWLPVFQINGADRITESGLGIWSILSTLIIAGILIKAFRLAMQLLSFQKIIKKATIITNEQMNLYQVNEKIIPFSFGNSIFINSSQHTEQELKEIIQHEMVHVKQKHSIDIIWSEILCVVNWFNPFAWFIRKAIRQNLEFIADNQVLYNGIDRKQYQYLLLKVIGNNHFSIAPKFNFSSLKKRIAMMNKFKSTKVNLLRFLFALPLLAIVLVSFRKEIGATLKGSAQQKVNVPVVMKDTLPIVSTVTDKHFHIYIMKNNQDPLIIVKDKNKKEVARLLMSEWNKKDAYYNNLYGKIPPPPPIAAPAPPVAPVAPVEGKMISTELIKKMNVSGEKIEIWLKDGTKENYNTNNKTELETFEKKYGKLPPPPPAPPTPERNNKSVSTTTAAPVPSSDLNYKMDGNADIVVAPANPKGTNSATTISTEPIGNKPLVILNGMVINNESMKMIDPETIQSVNVLKGTAAIDMHGDKGKDGVIIITTKSAVSVKENSESKKKQD